MKKIFVLIGAFALACFAVFSIVACKGTPARSAEETTQPPSREPGPSWESGLSREPRAPELAVSLSPRFFSPDGDGVNDIAFLAVSCKGESPIEEWKFAIREPGQAYQVFYERSGKGNPPAQIAWDGRGSTGELVQSATDYPFTLTVKDIRGLSSTSQGSIGVDVLVIREGNQMRMQVPSIVFGSNTGGFSGLEAETLDRNDYILRRVAEVLDKFNTYKVTVEGHANLTAETEADRRLEHELELQPLSEQRANFVVDYLVRLGVDRSRLTAIGVGGARPVSKYEDRANWWKNRRVEFILNKA